MTARGSFKIPRYSHDSTKGARKAYFAMWNREWPYDDVYLRQLGLEFDGTCNEFCRSVMRQDHDFEKDKA